MPYGETVPPAGAPVVQLQVADRTPYIYNANSGDITRGGVRPTGRKLSSTVDHHERPWQYNSYLDVGIFRDTLAPSLALHSGLAVVAYGVGKYAGRDEVEEALWPGGLLLNAWWSSVGRFVVSGERSFSTSLKVLSWPERLILGGVTLWAGQKLVRLAYGSAKKSNREVLSSFEVSTVRKDGAYWDRTLVNVLLPEALLQSIVALPLTAPFRHQGGVLCGYHPLVQMTSVAIWGAGFGLGSITAHKSAQAEGDPIESAEANQESVWSLVRRPDLLADTLVHLSFPLLLYASDMLAPVELLGPLANYLYLRNLSTAARATIGSEGTLQEKFDTRNAMWPNLQALQSPVTGVLVGCGVAALAVERAFWMWHMN